MGTDVEKTKIELTLDKDFKKALVFEIAHTFGDGIKLEDAILNILQEWIQKQETQHLAQEEYFEELPADAYALPEDQKDFFEFAAPALEAGVLDIDYRLDFLNWNGNSLENIQRARAQAIEILSDFNDGELRRKLYRNILEAVRENKEEEFFDSLTGVDAGCVMAVLAGR
ncbi:MAG: hypothetical protein QME59_07650, partial [Candidatus Hydrothermarchaeota archaeon]|nr:hypothetical protein [Candidatus Hydrothermarchaeota archaeon]